MTDDAPGTEAWKEETSAFDRVWSVARTLSEPKPPSYIAEEAHVTENTARNHLERLVDMTVLLKSNHEGMAMYSPDPLHTRIQALRELLDDNDHDDLLRLKAELQEKIEAWRDEYEAESPGELRKRAAETTSARETRDISMAASDWELGQYRLSIVEDAIENYETYTHESQTLEYE